MLNRFLFVKPNVPWPSLKKKEAEEVRRGGWRQGKEGSKRARKRRLRARAQPRASQPPPGPQSAAAAFAPLCSVQPWRPGSGSFSPATASARCALQRYLVWLACRLLFFYAEGRWVRKSKHWLNPRATICKPTYSNVPPAQASRTRSFAVVTRPRYLPSAPRAALPGAFSLTTLSSESKTIQARKASCLFKRGGRWARQSSEAPGSRLQTSLCPFLASDAWQGT